MSLGQVRWVSGLGLAADGEGFNKIGKAVKEGKLRKVDGGGERRKRERMSIVRLAERERGLGCKGKGRLGEIGKMEGGG